MDRVFNFLTLALVALAIMVYLRLLGIDVRAVIARIQYHVQEWSIDRFHVVRGGEILRRAFNG